MAKGQKIYDSDFFIFTGKDATYPSVITFVKDHFNSLPKSVEDTALRANAL